MKQRKGRKCQNSNVRQILGKNSSLFGFFSQSQDTSLLCAIYPSLSCLVLTGFSITIYRFYLISQEGKSSRNTRKYRQNTTRLDHLHWLIFLWHTTEEITSVKVCILHGLQGARAASFKGSNT